MSIKERIQEALKEAMRNQDKVRLESLRLAKAALLLKEKETPKEHALTDEEAAAALRAEVKKRRQSIETYQSVGRTDVVQQLEAEIAVFEEFLPKQLSEEELEARVRAYLAEHPDLNHPGKLTGALKKELGPLADGKMLNDICRKVLGA